MEPRIIGDSIKYITNYARNDLGKSTKLAQNKGVTAAESPVRFVEAGRSLLVIDNSAKEIVLTVVDLASGHRQLWKRLSLSVLRKGKTIAVTPDLKYYAYCSPQYSSDLYLVENLH